MNGFGAILASVIPVFVIVGVGFACRRVGWLDKQADQSLFRIAVNILFPSLIFESIVGNANLKSLDIFIIAPLVGVATVIIGYALSYVTCRIWGIIDPISKKSFSYSVAIYNYGYICIPLTLALFGKETLGVLFVFNMGVEAALWLMAATVGKAGQKIEWGKLFNPPVYAIVIAAAINLTGQSGWIPTFLHNTLFMLGACAIPVGIILVGATTADLLEEGEMSLNWRVMFGACLLRLAAVPAIFLAMAIFLPVSIELKTVLMLQAAMPAAIFPIVLIRHYGGDVFLALAVTISTSLASIVTLPAWIKVGIRLLGLKILP